MERLKAILADKILDLSAANSDDVRVTINKIHRFRDFVNACQTLMTKYPQIEDELIKMVSDGDFDTQVASSRVDSVIRLYDKASHLEAKENEADKLLVQDIQTVEDTDFQEIDESDIDSKNGYVPDEVIHTESIEENDIELSVEESEELEAQKKRKETIRRVVQIVGVILAVVILIIVIKFVIKHWIAILSIAGAIAIIGLVIWFIKKKKS